MTENLPKITVITATFNLIKDGREAFFRQCVESVHNQTYPNIEHIVMDGASTDGTLDLIREYEKKGWLKCYSEPDEGMVDAMNKGIKKASGEYIAILNSDDWYPDYAMAESIKKIQEEDADYSYGITDCLQRDNGKLYWKWTVSSYSFAFFYFIMPYNHESMLCKKSVYEELNYYNHKEYGTIADYDFAQRLILNDYKGVYIEKVILNFRWDGSTNFSKKENIKSSYRSHLSNLLKLYRNLWAKFLPEYQQNRLDGILNCRDYFDEVRVEAIKQDWFVYPFIKFISEKKLKNYPYEVLFQSLLHEHAQTNCDNAKKVKNVKLFFVFPFLKIRQKGNTSRLYLFGFIPFLKIKSKK